MRTAIQQVMGLRALWCGILLGVSFTCGQLTMARVIKVPSDYETISEATYHAIEGDEIVIAPGIYREQINIGGRDLIVRSTFNGDWSVVRDTIIDGGSYGPSVVIYGGSGNCVLRGFTLLNGLGAIRGDDTHATIENNIITQNASPGAYKGTIENCDGLIQNNIIESNAACNGGAFSHCDGTIQNNLIRNNLTVGAELPTNPITPFVPPQGGAFFQCNGTIRNNTVVDNFVCKTWWATAPTRPGGFAACTGTIVNNIIYHTTMTQPAELDGSTSPTYCLFRTPRSGAGNITGDPRFVNPAAGNFRLRPDSPCLDAGCAAPGLTNDLVGHPRPYRYLFTPHGDGSAFDLGALETVRFNAARVALWPRYD